MSHSPEGLSFSVSLRAGALSLSVSLDTGPGPLAIVGPNGAGKTTLLECVLGARPGVAGRVRLGGVVLLDSSAGLAVPVEMRRIGYVPQEYALFPHLTVRENVSFAVESAGHEAGRAQGRRVAELLGELALNSLADRLPGRLSGGERQRVALARALAIRPRALLLDEPLAALDIDARRDVLSFLAEYLRALSIPALVVTHEAKEARALAPRVAVLERGALSQLGSWEEVAARPASPFVASFLGGRGQAESED